MSLVYHYLKERKVLYATYLGLCLILVATFYLYELPWESLADAFLFAGFLLVLISLWDFSRYYRDYQALHVLQARLLTLEELKKLPKGQSLLTREYQALLRQTVKEQEAVSHQAFETNQQLLDYYAMWSHQIKTPLAALDLLVQTEAPAPALMKQELVKMEGYLDMMLHYLRMHHLNEDLVIETVDLQALVKEVIRKYALFFIEKDLNVQVADFDKKVTMDRKWLSFILEQVLFNSIKYTAVGGVTITLVDEALIIEDSGIGIMAQDLPRIFAKGFTGFNGRETQKATGLGLYMSQQVATRLGIELSITSTLGEGTRAKIQFPQVAYQLE